MPVPSVLSPGRGIAMEVPEYPFDITPFLNVVLEDLQMTSLAGWFPKAPQAM